LIDIGYSALCGRIRHRLKSEMGRAKPAEGKVWHPFVKGLREDCDADDLPTPQRELKCGRTSPANLDPGSRRRIRRAMLAPMKKGDS
jgi:hypothetical protein